MIRMRIACAADAKPREDLGRGGEYYDFMHNVEMWWGLDLGRLGVENDEDGVGVGGGEGGDSGDEMGMGCFREGKVKPRVCDGAISSV